MKKTVLSLTLLALLALSFILGRYSIQRKIGYNSIKGFLQVKSEENYVFLATDTDPISILDDDKIDHCVLYGGIGVDLLAKDDEGYVIKNVLKKHPADTVLYPGDKITSPLEIIRGKTRDPIKVYYKTKNGENKTALMTRKPVKKCYLK